MANFMNMMANNLNTGYTENGAKVYKSTNNALVDINYFLSSLRTNPEVNIIGYWTKAFYENKELALRWLFFARDAREGVGERHVFRVIMRWLAKNETEIARRLISIIPFFGRWDDICCLLRTPVEADVIAMIKNQLQADLDIVEGREEGDSISLMAKWLPSINASGDTAKDGTIVRKGLGMSEKTYRKTLAKLRKYLDVVEVKMSAREWGDIKYESVPSIANIRYTNAFKNHDEERRTKYLEELKAGKTKINASVAFPHEIISQMRHYGCANDATFEEMWKALPNRCKDGMSDTLVVCDGSGSMTCHTMEGSCVPLDVAYAMSIYFSEKMSGQFHDKFITFSANPQIVDLSRASSLREKINILQSHEDCTITDLYKVFKLVLDTAIENHLSQEELPGRILIITDGEFDGMCMRTDEYLFKTIGDTFNRNGYKLPKLIFWNVANRSMTIPVKENANGVALVSGFSPNIANMIMSEKTDPAEILIDQIMDIRYAVVSQCLEGLL